jgi:hypothetical protein
LKQVSFGAALTRATDHLKSALNPLLLKGRKWGMAFVVVDFHEDEGRLEHLPCLQWAVSRASRPPIELYRNSSVS